MKKNIIGGYTIVELLIVLAVTGVIAVGAFSSIQGQQARTEFTQALRDFDAKLLDIANDVSNGYYPNTTSVKECQLNIVEKPEFTTSTTTQGNSSQCIFIGKAIQFEPDTQEGSLNIMTIAGRRIFSGRDVSSLSEANPRPVTALAGYELTENIPINFGMRVKSVTPSTGALAFLTSFGNIDTATGDVTGSPVTDVKYIDMSSLGQPKDDLALILEDHTNYLDPPATGLQICLEKDDRTALLTIGSLNRKLATETEVVPC